MQVTLQQVREWMEVSTGLLAIVWWIVAPSIRHYVRKIMADEQGAIKVLERKVENHDLRLEQIEQGLEKIDRVGEELPLMTQAIGEMRTAMGSVERCMDRIQDVIAKHTEELGRLRGHQEAQQKK
jgi:hypothetical protein